MMKKLLIGIIRFYQRAISANTPPVCRFTPTCSHYGLEAIERFGAVKGSFMTMRRILRCNPWNPGGYDPVPEKKIKIEKYKHIDYKDVKYKKKKQ